MLSPLFIAALWSTDLLALAGDVYCIFVTFPCGILAQVWYSIVLIPDLCRLSYFAINVKLFFTIKHMGSVDNLLVDFYNDFSLLRKCHADKCKWI